MGLIAAIGLPIRTHISPPGPETPWYAWVLALTLQPLFVVQAVVFTRWVNRRPLSDLPMGADKNALRTALWGSALSVLLMAVYVGLTSVSGLVTWHWNARFAPAATVLMALLTAQAGFGEEFFFRGYIMNTLGAYGTRAAIIISSVVFALIHMVVGRFSPLDQMALLLHGLMFALIAHRTRSLWPGIIIHFVYNGLTSLVWSGDPDTALLAFDGDLGWTKWAFKAVMVIPYLLMLWAVYRTPAKEGQKQAA